MILGIGTDIIELSRIAKVVKRFDDKFVRRILTDTEHKEYLSTLLSIQFLAARFAAKEACAKALGTGMSSGVDFKGFAVKKNSQTGKPMVELLDQALEISKQHFGISRWHLTLSHEKEYALAFVIWESV